MSVESVLAEAIVPIDARKLGHLRYDLAKGVPDGRNPVAPTERGRRKSHASDCAIPRQDSRQTRPARPIPAGVSSGQADESFIPPPRLVERSDPKHHETDHEGHSSLAERSHRWVRRTDLESVSGVSLPEWKKQSDSFSRSIPTRALRSHSRNCAFRTHSSRG